MKMKLVFALALLVVAGGVAHARPQFVAVLTQTYPQYAGPLQQRSCMNCHISMSNLQRNAYGKQIEAAMTAASATQLTPAILHKVESMDAAGDGVTNLTRIQKGLPPAGSPGAGPAVGSTGTAGSGSSASSSPASRINPASWSWLPKNGFHPAIVHFPIALFIAGLFLDFIGLIRKKDTFLFAGWWNLLLAAVSALGACATGLLAILLQSVPVTGLIRTHLSLAVLATVIMWIMVAMRVHRHEKIAPTARVVYYILAAINFCVISYTGHLGGMFVYGS